MRRWPHVAALALGLALLPACAASRSASFADNEIVLSRAESLRLVNWAERFRSCLKAHGFHVGDVVPRSKQIDIELLAKIPGPKARVSIACGDGLGGPPARSALQISPPGFVLFLPKRCLLDPKVTAPKGDVPLP